VRSDYTFERLGSFCCSEEMLGSIVSSQVYAPKAETSLGNRKVHRADHDASPTMLKTEGSFLVHSGLLICERTRKLVTR
jgi:hypothetical protein